MTKESKVTKAVFNRSYDGSFGTMHVHDIAFENGDVGQYTSKSKEQTNFVEGETVSYNIDAMKDKKGNAYNKISPNKEERAAFTPSSPSSGSAAKKFVDNSVGMMVGASINNAALLAAHGKIDIDDIQAVATALCDISIRLKEKYS